jgi:hypothetical protein
LLVRAERKVVCAKFRTARRTVVPVRHAGRGRVVRQSTAGFTEVNTITIPMTTTLTLDAQAGQARLGEVFHTAGFTRFRSVAWTPFNIVLEARL